MTDSMIERVARAIVCINPTRCSEGSASECDACLKTARAAIEALREPTPEMMEAGRCVMPVFAGSSGEPDHADARHTWYTMIDAALNEKAGT